MTASGPTATESLAKTPPRRRYPIHRCFNFPTTLHHSLTGRRPPFQLTNLQSHKEESHYSPKRCRALIQRPTAAAPLGLNPGKDLHTLDHIQDRLPNFVELEERATSARGTSSTTRPVSVGNTTSATQPSAVTSIPYSFPVRARPRAEANIPLFLICNGSLLNI